MDKKFPACDLCRTDYTHDSLTAIILDESKNVCCFEYAPYRPLQMKLCKYCVDGIAKHSQLYNELAGKVHSLKEAFKDLISE